MAAEGSTEGVSSFSTFAVLNVVPTSARAPRAEATLENKISAISKELVHDWKQHNVR